MRPRISPARSVSGSPSTATSPPNRLVSPRVSSSQPAGAPGALVTPGAPRTAWSPGSRPISRSCPPRWQAGGERAVHHDDQRHDVEDGAPGLALDVGGVGRHVGALEHDRADVRVIGDEPAGDPNVLLARGV